MANLYMQNVARPTGYSRPGSRFKWTTPAPGQTGPLPSSAAPTGVGPSMGSQSMSQGNQQYTQPTLNTAESFAPPSVQTPPQSVLPTPSTPSVMQTNAAFADPMQQRKMLSDIHGYSAPLAGEATSLMNAPAAPPSNNRYFRNVMDVLMGRQMLRKMASRPKRSVNIFGRPN